MKLKEMDIHLTNRCNLTCKTCCYSSNQLKLDELTKSQLLSVLDQAISLGCEDFHLSGGEPLLRKDLFDLIACILDKNVGLRLQTNGKLLTKANAKQLNALGLKDLMISLDGHTAGICDAQRGIGSYQGAIEGIRNALDEGLNVRVNAVLTTMNSEHFPEIVDLAILMGVKTCSSFYFTPIGRGSPHRNLWINPLDYIRLFSRLTSKLSQMNSIYRDTDIIVEKAYATWSEALSMSIDGFTGCGGGCGHVLSNRDYLIVRCDGNIYPCILLIDSPFSLGNVKHEALEEIWRDAKAWQILDRERAKSECGDCSHIGLCNGGCAGYANILSGSHSRPDPRCIKGEVVPLCPIMKYNFKNDRLGGSSDDVLKV